MKLKILVVPFAIIAILTLSIWYVKPKFDEWRAKKVTLNNKKALLANMLEKNNKMLVWRDMIEKNPENKNVILDYIPASVNEEDIIDNLSSIAVNNSVSLSDFVLSSPTVVADVAASSAVNGVAAVDPGVASADEMVTNSKLKEQMISVSFVAYGDYDKIKNFLLTASSLKRFNEVNSLKLASNAASTSPGAEASAATGMLKVEITLFFNYAKKENIVSSVNDAVFEGNLDMSIAESIRNAKSVDVNKLTVGQSGKGNPFSK